MPPTRGRPPVILNNNENNENTRRVTRAKAAALTDYDLAKKKPLQSTKPANGVNSNATQRRRAALGDVTNATKGSEPAIGDGKKAVGAKVGLASKAAPAGVQKLSRTNLSRSGVGLKDNNVKPKPAAAEPKRRISGSGSVGKAHKKRTQSSTSSVQSGNDATTGTADEPPRKKACAKSEVEGSEVQVEVQARENVVVTAETSQPEIFDIDAEDADDPMLIAEYVQEIFEYYKQLEEATLPNPHYIASQMDIDWNSRAVLIDWLIEVHTRFRLTAETLFLTVNIIDRFLSTRVVPLNTFQLVGVTAMFIAAKYEEVLSPHVSAFVNLADDEFTVEEVLSAERHILGNLNYDLSYPSPMHFLRRVSKADQYDIQTRTVAKYLMEISLVDHNFMPYRQSHVAAGAIYVARIILDRGPWDATMEHYSGYSEEEILPIFELMLDYLHRPVAHEAFFKKYASKKFMKASIFARKWAKVVHAMRCKQDAAVAHVSQSARHKRDP